MADTLFPEAEDQVSLSEQIRVVEREVKLREFVYPRRVAKGDMTQSLADRETAGMRAVLKTLRELWEASR
jgi:hypothetical protein